MKKESRCQRRDKSAPRSRQSSGSAPWLFQRAKRVKVSSIKIWTVNVEWHRAIGEAFQWLTKAKEAALALTPHDTEINFNRHEMFMTLGFVQNSFRWVNDHGLTGAACAEARRKRKPKARAVNRPRCGLEME